MKISDASVAALKLPDGKSELLVFDDAIPRFGVRLRSGGKKTFVVQFRVGVQQRRISIGTVGVISATEARNKAKDALAQAQLGTDPQAAKIEARAPQPKGLTLGELVERYLPVAEKRLKTSTYSGLLIHLKKHWTPLHDVEISRIERRQVAAELNRIGEGTTGIGANLSRAALSSLFSWAMGEGLVENNPVIGTNKPGVEVSRERVLTDPELKLIWANSGSGDYASIVKLLMLTGQRREEIGALRWSEIDLAKSLWSLPKTRTKNKRSHEVPLAVPVHEILQGLPRQAGRDLVFGEGEGGFSGWSKCKERLDERLKVAVLTEDWVLHDLRRTCATMMGELGVQPHIVEAVTNHVSGSKAGVAGIYNRASYSAEKKAALDIWAAHVMALVG